jgi:heme/copper-type cytochrome/quinol oxidase subunit 2
MKTVIDFLSRWWLPLALGATIWLVPFPIQSGSPLERHFQVEASRFAYSPTILYANPGDRVTIDLVSGDVVHGLAIDGYDLGITSDPGQTARLSFVANQSGSFRFRCTVTCGAMHPFMIGKLQVGDNNLLWRSAGLAVFAVLMVLWRRV